MRQPLWNILLTSLKISPSPLVPALLTCPQDASGFSCSLFFCTSLDFAVLNNLCSSSQFPRESESGSLALGVGTSPLAPIQNTPMTGKNREVQIMGQELVTDMGLSFKSVQGL